MGLLTGLPKHLVTEMVNHWANLTEKPKVISKDCLTGLNLATQRAKQRQMDFERENLTDWHSEKLTEKHLGIWKDLHSVNYLDLHLQKETVMERNLVMLTLTVTDWVMMKNHHSVKRMARNLDWQRQKDFEKAKRMDLQMVI